MTRSKPQSDHEGGAVIVKVPGGLLLGGVGLDHAEEVAERIARWIPERARAYDPDRAAWTIIEPFERTVRAIVLTTCGTIRELSNANYADGLARLRTATSAGQVAA